ncbi:hypothetical protein B0J17DRAFT_582683 [Rhizoctonia solani]|nr:hypothetical protein B0J17DRAFT_582683 [Rhizoctonia solani]
MNTDPDLTISPFLLPPASQTSPDVEDRQRTDPPTNYVHEYEIEIARWQARRTARRARRQRQFTCSVCLEIKGSSDRIRPTARCVHEPQICEPCLEQYVRHAVRTEGLIEVRCPGVKCRGQLAAGEVVKYVQGDPVCLNRYNELIAQRELESHPNFIWCQNPRCSRGQIHNEGDASPLVICQYCHEFSCFTHRVPWHNGVTCKDYTTELRKGQVNANESYIGEHTKRCPNSRCKRPIEKISGCDRMTCQCPGGCGHEFCWECLAEYNPIRNQGNHMHNPDCRHYARNSTNWDGFADLPRRGANPPRRRQLTIRGLGRALLRGRPPAQPEPRARPAPRVRPRARSIRRLVVLNFLFGRS